LTIQAVNGVRRGVSPLSGRQARLTVALLSLLNESLGLTIPPSLLLQTDQVIE
jgi:hypothetical protein